MRDIKFSYLLQHDETGRIIEKIYDFNDIFNGDAGVDIESLSEYSIIAVREYSGLKDKNNKGIYEGDILKQQFRYFSSDKEDTIRFAVVEFQGGEFVGRKRKREGNCTSLWAFLNTTPPYEVVGNVFEHPDLIAQKEERE